MERCDFCSVCGAIRSNTDDAFNQVEFFEKLFEDYARETLSVFNVGLINRWLRGLKQLSSAIIKYYSADDKADTLVKNFSRSILPHISDYNVLTQAVHDLVLNDVSISDNTKTELLHNYPCDSKPEAAEFVCNILIFAMSRPFVTRDTKIIEKQTSSGALSPIVSERIFGADIPAPCKHFSGRDKEIAELHDILSDNNKVFVSGIGGIGKSEFVKVFAGEYKKEFTNILYFVYTGSLRDMIIDIDFSDDRPEDSDDERFKRHNRYLRSLKDDTLIVIDNFDTTASDEDLLDVVMKYKCRVIFTTRSKFDCGYTYSLNEITDIDGLFELFGKLYSEADKNRDTVINIIEAVNRHTLSVELAARLLEKGLLSPDEVLQKLTDCSVDPETSDRINIHKDGKGVKATFYEHIRALFSLCSLTDNQKTIMRCMAFIPAEGINARVFCRWLELPDMNDINDLVELGFVQMTEDRILLHQIIKEITLVDLQPKMTDCKAFLISIMNICLAHGADIFRYDLLFQTIGSIIDLMIKDAPADYLLFLETAFAYMEKYNYGYGMKKIIVEMTDILRDNSLGTVNDRALLLNNKASYESSINGKSKIALPLLQEALEFCVPADNIALYANINMNLGCTYLDLHDMKNAEKYMMTAIEITKQANIVSHDFIIMVHNYATLLANNKSYEKAVAMLMQCADFVHTFVGDMCLDYADPIYEAAEICLLLGDEMTAQRYFDEAFRIYSSVLDESDLSKRKAAAANVLSAYQNKKQKRLSDKK